MKNKLKISSFIFLLLAGIFLFEFCFAVGPLKDSGAVNDQVDILKQTAGFADASAGGSVGSIIATVISGFLGFLAIIFIILIILAGYRYMNAEGNEEKTTEALDTIKRAIIGLVIIISAYAITYFVFNAMDWWGGGGNGPGGSP